MTTQSRPGGARTVIANIALSLDGRVAGPGGEYDMGWIIPHAISDAARDHMIGVATPATTVLLGRKNYEGFGGYWPAIAGDESADPRDRAFAKWLDSVEKIVFSATLKQFTWQNSRIVDSDPATVVEDLRQNEGGDIIVLASGSVIKSLLRADALDRLSITLCPEVAGGGARLFEDDLPASSWTLRQSTITQSGALCLLYDRVREGSGKQWDVVVTRTLDAPVELVWQAWSDAEQVMRWWGPKGFTSPSAAMDFREGGRSLVCMRAPKEFGGQDMYNTWTYSKIEPHKLIEFIVNFTDEHGAKLDPAKIGMPPGVPQDVRHVITFKAVAHNRTEMTVTEYGYTLVQAHDISKAGLEQCLDKMAAAIGKE